MRVWAPGHATLFFSTPERRVVPSEMGSIGGGLNFEAGIITELSKNGNNIVNWNEEKINGKVTLTALRKFETVTGISCKNIDIHHTSVIPIGYGLSTSGAGAIGTTIALNETCNTQLDILDIYEIAHYADVINHTGLGSVVGQMISGIELRLSQGGPKLCKTKKFTSNDEVVLVFFGPLSTADVLTSKDHMIRVTNAGLDAIKKVKQKNYSNLEEMIQLGRSFTNKCGLLTKRLSNQIFKLEEIGERNVTMAMIGETLIIKPSSIESVMAYLNEKKVNYLRTRIQNNEPKIIVDD